MTANCSSLSGYKKNIKLLVMLITYFFLVSFFYVFDFIYDMFPAKNMREFIMRLYHSLNSGSIVKILIKNFLFSNMTNITALVTLISLILSVSYIAFKGIKLISLKPIINVNVLENSNPFLYSNKTRSLRE